MANEDPDEQMRKFVRRWLLDPETILAAILIVAVALYLVFAFVSD